MLLRRLDDIVFNWSQTGKPHCRSSQKTFEIFFCCSTSSGHWENGCTTIALYIAILISNSSVADTVWLGAAVRRGARGGRGGWVGEGVGREGRSAAIHAAPDEVERESEARASDSSYLHTAGAPSPPRPNSRLNTSETRTKDFYSHFSHRDEEFWHSIAHTTQVSASPDNSIIVLFVIFFFPFGTSCSSCRIRGQHQQSKRGLLLRESFKRPHFDFACKNTHIWKQKSSFEDHVFTPMWISHLHIEFCSATSVEKFRHTLY